MTLEIGLFWLLATLAVVTVPVFGLQAARIRRQGHAGVSPSSWLLMVASQTLWVTYGTAIGDAALQLNVITGVASVWVFLTWASSAKRLPHGIVAVLVTVSFVAVSGVTFVPVLALGLVASVTDLATAWPQAARAMLAKDVSGVSAKSWALRCFIVGTWAVYGWVASVTVLAVTATAKTVACCLVVATVMHKRANET